ncbi:unnamed protein product [Closterium sp. Naga37s-1]|nr:unnamed protein product [Closterium sp. Naga37s-1]
MGTPAAGPKCRNAFPARALCKFVDDLATTMRVAVDTSDGKLVRIGVYQIYQKFHRDLPPTKQYAYGLNQRTAAFPGPTILAQKGKDTQIFWSNHIKDKKHMIQLDDTLMIPMPKKGGVPIVPHRHGGETHSTYDGHPQAWFTQFGESGPTFSTRLYHYHNSQRPSIVWYHDHAIAITRINVMAGMAGLYVIMDPKGEEKEINKWAPLPGGPFVMPLAIADRMFFPNGSVNYPVDGVVPKEHPHWQPEFFGDTITVNGKVWPYFRVRRALYRLPILGASNARFYHLRFQCAVRGDYHDFKPPFRGPIIPMTQINSDPPYLPHPLRMPRVLIGSDSGYLARPLHMKDVLMAPGERYDIGSDGGYLARPLRMKEVLVAPGERLDMLVDFNEAPSWCRDVLLTNDARAPYPAGERVSPGTAVIMRFILTKRKAIPAPPLPKMISVSALATKSPLEPGLLDALHMLGEWPLAPLPFNQVTKSRWHVLGERVDPDSDMPTTIVLSPPYSPLTPSNPLYTSPHPSTPLPPSPPPSPWRPCLSSRGGGVRERGVTLDLDPETDMPTVIQLKWSGYFQPATEILSNGAVEVWHIINPSADTHPIHLHLTTPLSLLLTFPTPMQAGSSRGGAVEGAVEVWHIINPSADSHPIHLHLLQHRPFARRSFNSEAFLSDDFSVLTTGEVLSILVAVALRCVMASSPPLPSLILPTLALSPSPPFTSLLPSLPYPILLPTPSPPPPPPPPPLLYTSPFPPMAGREAVSFEPSQGLGYDGKPFEFDPSVGPGYVWQRHFLEHEDNDMMPHPPLLSPSPPSFPLPPLLSPSSPSFPLPALLSPSSPSFPLPSHMAGRQALQDGKPFSFDPSQGPGYVWHCHILEHEDNDMMRPLLVRK